MKKEEVMANVTRTAHRIGFKLKKHSPEILIVAGVVGTVASTVMACKATLKVNEVMDEHKENIDKIHEATELGVTAAGKEYSAEDSKKDLTIQYTQTGVKLAKLYGPAIVLGGLSLTAILASNNILRKRYVASAAAYAAIDKSFKEYRGRVVERFGKDLDYELKHGIKTKEIEETVVNEDGTETKVTSTVDVVNPNEYSAYARFFDDGCTGWSKDPEMNKLFLKSQEKYANQKLKTNGYLFLNEVYAMLGIPQTKEGQIVGWVYSEDNPIGDNFVDFGLLNPRSEATRRFVNGYERTILLDFNVDGNILDKM